MNLTKSTALAFLIISALAVSGCTGTADSAAAPKTSTAPDSVSATDSATATASETTPATEEGDTVAALDGVPTTEDLTDVQSDDFTSVIDYPTAHNELVTQLFEESPLGEAAQLVTHKDVAFVFPLNVVTGRQQLQPNLGGKADPVRQPQDSGLKIADAGVAVDTYFTAVMNALETGDSSQIGKIAWEHCYLCNDTIGIVNTAADPDTYKEALIYSAGAVFPSSTMEFVKTDGLYYHFKASAVERVFFSSIDHDPWITRVEDGGNFVMDIVVAELASGWVLAYYDVTSK